jgi:leucyl aminopeptidase (aminopeptidase T)
MDTMVASYGLYKRVAKKVLSETLAVKNGEAVTVESWNNGLEFARSVVAEARAMGCTAVLLLEDEEAYIEGIGRGPRDMIGVMGRNEYRMIEGTDAYVFIPGPLLAAYQTRIKPQLMSDSTKYNESWYNAAEKAKLRGARLAFGYVGEEMAGVMGRTVQQVVERQLSAALVDFGCIAKSAQRLSLVLADGADALLHADGSRLQFTLKGETTIEDGVVSREDVDAGNNMTYVPPGFVSRSVDPASVSGTLRVSKTLTRLGLLEDAVLAFREGRLVRWKSRGSMPMLTELVKAVPEKKRKMTILNVGINPKMGYLFGQDRMVAGSVTAGGFGFMAVIRRADLTVGRRHALTGGKL